MQIIDHNGTGIWSVEQVLRRYVDYVKKYQINEPRDLSPEEYSGGDRHWISPVMDCVIKGIREGDLACAEIGVEFIEEDQGLPFGRMLKSNTARALRQQTSLTEEQKERIRKRIVSMLNVGYIPREYREYAKLGRKIGLGRWLKEINPEANDNPWIDWYHRYFQENANH